MGNQSCSPLFLNEFSQAFKNICWTRTLYKVLLVDEVVQNFTKTSYLFLSLCCVLEQSFSNDLWWRTILKSFFDLLQIHSFVKCPESIMHLDFVAVASCSKSFQMFTLNFAPLIIHKQLVGQHQFVYHKALLNELSMDQQHQGTCQKCRFLGPTPDLPNLHLHFNKTHRGKALFCREINQTNERL